MAPPIKFTGNSYMFNPLTVSRLFRALKFGFYNMRNIPLRMDNVLDYQHKYLKTSYELPYNLFDDCKSRAKTVKQQLKTRSDENMTIKDLARTEWSPASSNNFIEILGGLRVSKIGPRLMSPLYTVASYANKKYV